MKRFLLVEAKIKAYQREKFVQLNRRDSRTLAAAGTQTCRRC